MVFSQNQSLFLHRDFFWCDLFTIKHFEVSALSDFCIITCLLSEIATCNFIITSLSVFSTQAFYSSV